MPTDDDIYFIFKIDYLCFRSYLDRFCSAVCIGFYSIKQYKIFVSNKHKMSSTLKSVVFYINCRNS